MFAALLLYVLTAAALLAAWRRFLQPVSLAASLVIAAMPLVFTGHAMLTGRIYAPADLPYRSEPLNGYARELGIREHNGWLTDLSTQMIPWRAAVRNAIAQGEWPLLNPYILGGDPLAASAQPAAYDPVNLLSLLIPLGASFTYSATMTFFLAALFTFAFARMLGCSEHAALVAAAGWTFCGTMAFAVGWPLARSWAFLPLVLFATRATVRDPRVKHAALLTLSLVLTILAGHPETVLHVVAIGIAYGLFELPKAPPGRRRSTGTIAVVCGVVALLLTAFFLLPFVDALDQTREHGARNEGSRGEWHPNREVSQRRLGAAVLPFWGGQSWRGMSTPLFDPLSTRSGSVILALGIAGALFVRGRDKWFLAALALVSYSAAAELPPVENILHALPLFNITINHRLAWSAMFAMSLLAAMAIDAIPARRAAIALGSVGIAIAVLTAIVWRVQLAAGVGAWWMRNVTIVELLALAIAIVALVKRKPAIILGVVLAQRAYVDGGVYPAIAREAFYPRVPVIDAMKSDAPFRVVGFQHALTPATGALYGLEDARGYQAMTFARLFDTYPLWCIPQPVWFNRVADLSKPFLSMMNVRFAIGTTNDQPPPHWRVVLDDRGSRLFENERVLPRAFIPRRVRLSQSDAAIRDALPHVGDFAELALILDPHAPSRTLENGHGSLRVRKDGLALRIASETDGATWIVISQSAWRGWRAYVDGQRKPLYIANHAFLGMLVPGGKHEVRLLYRPDSFVRGLTISAATLLALLLAFAFVRLRR